MRLNFLIIFLLIIFNVTLLSSAEQKWIPLGKGQYNISFDAERNCRVEPSNDGDDNDTILQENVMMQDEDGFWNLYFRIIIQNESEYNGNHYQYSRELELRNPLILHLKDEFGVDEKEITESFCNCGEDLEAYSASFFDQALNKKIIAYHLKFEKLKRLYIWMIGANGEKASRICRTISINKL